MRWLHAFLDGSERVEIEPAELNYTLVACPQMLPGPVTNGSHALCGTGIFVQKVLYTRKVPIPLHFPVL